MRVQPRHTLALLAVAALLGGCGTKDATAPLLRDVPEDRLPVHTP